MPAARGIPTSVPLFAPARNPSLVSYRTSLNGDAFPAQSRVFLFNQRLSPVIFAKVTRLIRQYLDNGEAIQR